MTRPETTKIPEAFTARGIKTWGLTIASVADLGGAMRRIALTGPALEAFACEPGSDMMVPLAENGGPTVCRRYTIRHFDRASRRLDLDLVLLGLNESVDAERVRAFVTGERITLAPGELLVRGMPLWEHLMARTSEVRVGSDSACTVSVSLEGRSGARAEIVNVPSTLVRGLEGFRLECALPGELFTFTLSATRPEITGGAPNIRASFSLSLDAWLGRDVRALPHFESIRAFAAMLDDAIAADLIVHLPGQNLPWPRFELPEREGAVAFARAVETLRKAREVVTVLERPLLFQQMVSDEDVVNVDRIHALVTTGEHRGSGRRTVVTIHFDRDQLNPQLLEADGGDFELRVKGRTDTDTVFGSALEYPVGTVLLTHALPARILPAARKPSEVRVQIRGSSASEFVLRSASG